MSGIGKAFIARVTIFAVSIGLVAVAQAEPTIRIGASASKTVAYAALGQNQLRGYQLCVKHTNEKGGVLGRKLELVVEDDQSQAAPAIAILDFNTVFGAFKVDADGLQIAHKMVTIQWQDSKRVIVWPEELAPGKLRFPTPPWNQRP
jgi:hypothetical protein